MNYQKSLFEDNNILYDYDEKSLKVTLSLIGAVKVL